MIPNAIVIDSAQSRDSAVSPKKMIAYVIALFFGLAIPFMIIYLSSLLDAKIHTREDVERALNIPIIGDIPKFTKKNRYLLRKDDYSSIAEAFRILRTNLSFVLPTSKSALNEGKNSLCYIINCT